MAKHKFASNVCEKAIAVSDAGHKRLLVEEMLAPGPDGVLPVSIMMKDQFANYVLQKALNVMDGELLDALVAVVWPQLVSMRRHPSAFTKHLNSSTLSFLQIYLFLTFCFQLSDCSRKRVFVSSHRAWCMQQCRCICKPDSRQMTTRPAPRPRKIL